MQTNFANTKPVVNAIKPTIEIWHQRMGHLSYRNILKLPQIAEGIEVKGPVPEEICGPCVTRRQRGGPIQVVKVVALLAMTILIDKTNTRKKASIAAEIFHVTPGTHFLT